MWWVYTRNDRRSGFVVYFLLTPWVYISNSAHEMPESGMYGNHDDAKLMGCWLHNVTRRRSGMVGLLIHIAGMKYASQQIRGIIWMI